MKKLVLFFVCSLFFCGAFAQPSNDNSCGAISIPVENLGCEPTTIYNYTGATWSSGSGNTWCANTQNLDVWYSFVVPANGQAIVAIDRISTAETYTAEMYNGPSCSSLTLFNSTTHGFPCLNSGESRTFNNLTPGATVFMRIFRGGGTTAAFANGSFKICVSNNYTLADEPCNAGFFPVAAQDPLGQDCMPVTTYSWTGATLTPAVPNPSCIAPMPGANVRDVWFKLRVPASGKLRVNHTYNGTCMTAYTATTCNGTFTEIGCTFFGLNWNNLTPNSIVYVRMMRYTGTSSAIADGSAKICAAESNQVPAANNTTNVGIGIDTPFAKLDVAGNGIFRDKLTALGDIETRGNLIVQGNILSKYGNTKLPDNTSVTGLLTLDSLALTNRLGNRISLYGGLGNTSHYGFGVQSGLLQIHSDAVNTGIAFGYGSSNVFFERARVINSGEFGFNVTGRLGLRTGSQSAGLWLNNSTNTGQVGFMGVYNDTHFGLYGPNGIGWGLIMNNTNGNIGIGNTNPHTPLSFNNPFQKIAISLFKGSLGDVGMGVWNNELRLQCDNPFGKVSLGTLDGSGNYMELVKAEQNAGYAMSVFGAIWANGITYSSDERFKQNITDIQTPLEKLLRLRGVEYEMKTKEFSKNHFPAGKQIGLIAQNVEQVVPEAVNEKDGYKGVDYAKLVPLLIEAIKEQNKKIEELERRLNQQRN